MRLPRLRFTVRRVMVAVAIVATILGVTTGIHRHGGGRGGTFAMRS